MDLKNAAAIAVLGRLHSRLPIANGLPFVFYDIHLMVNGGNRLFSCEQK